MRTPARATLAVLAVIAAATLLAACGDSDNATQTAPAEVRERTTAGGDSVDPQGQREHPSRQSNGGGAERNHSAKGKGHHHPAGEGESADDHPENQRQHANPEERHPSGGKGNNDKPAGAKSKTPPSCPQAMSAEQCAEAGKALEQSGTSQPVETGECPPALDDQACQEAGAAYQEAEHGSRPVSPEECPRAMTPEQCQAAGEAYAGAAK